jgi:hypothetical protein
MATAALPIRKSTKDQASPAYEVRVWSMDANGKAFIQTVASDGELLPRYWHTDCFCIFLGCNRSQPIFAH